MLFFIVLKMTLFCLQNCPLLRSIK